MKVYISGPITGYEDGNVKAFQEAEDYLLYLGYDPVNPHKLEHNHGKTWREYMNVDIKALVDCEAVFTLKGCTKSRGAKVEIIIAESLGLEVWGND